MKQIALTTIAFVLCCAAVLSCNKDDENISTGCPAKGIISYHSGRTHFGLPNAFSPNGDALNDRFGAIYINMDTSDFELIVMRGCDGILFRSKSIDDRWNGTYSDGTPAPSGLYNANVRFRQNDGILVDTCHVIALVTKHANGCIPAGNFQYVFEDEWDTNKYQPGTSEIICP